MFQLHSYIPHQKYSQDFGAVERNQGPNHKFDIEISGPTFWPHEDIKWYVWPILLFLIHRIYVITLQKGTSTLSGMLGFYHNPVLDMSIIQWALDHPYTLKYTKDKPTFEIFNITDLRDYITKKEIIEYQYISNIDKYILSCLTWIFGYIYYTFATIKSLKCPPLRKRSFYT